MVSVGVWLVGWIFLHRCCNIECSGLISGNPNMVMALAGNKADLEDKRKVTVEASIFF